MQFDPAISLHPEYDSGYGMMSNPISYSYFEGTRSKISGLDLETFSRSGSKRLKKIKIYFLKLENS